MEQRLWPAEPLPGTNEDDKDKSWAFEDSNAATHLIRNSLAGSNRKLFRQVLSCRGDHLREMRDDITTLFVFIGSFLIRMTDSRDDRVVFFDT